MRKGSSVPLFGRLLAKTIKKADNKCWLWIGVKRGGYGRLTYAGKYVTAHRMWFLFTYGFIPAGLEVLHKCDNPGCVNPKHLFLGTQKDNMIDCSKKGRMPFRKGENGSNHKVSNEQVLSIRRLANSGMPRKRLCEIYGLKRSQIHNIINRKCWKHI